MVSVSALVVLKRRTDRRGTASGSVLAASLGDGVSGCIPGRGAWRRVVGRRQRSTQYVFTAAAILVAASRFKGDFG